MQKFGENLPESLAKRLQTWYNSICTVTTAVRGHTSSGADCLAVTDPLIRQDNAGRARRIPSAFRTGQACAAQRIAAAGSSVHLRCSDC